MWLISLAAESRHGKKIAFRFWLDCRRMKKRPS